MLRYLSLGVLSVFVGNVVFALTIYGLYEYGFLSGLGGQFSSRIEVGRHSVELVKSTKLAPYSNPDAPKYMARLPIPGYSLKQCMKGQKELNEEILECSKLQVVTIYSREPITNNVEEGRKFIGDLCSGPAGQHMPEKELERWCGLYERLELFRDKIKVQPGWQIDQSSSRKAR